MRPGVMVLVVVTSATHAAAQPGVDDAPAGLTVEAGLGPGLVTMAFTRDTASGIVPVGAGMELALGHWFSPRTAVVGRISTVLFFNQRGGVVDEGLLFGGFLGPAIEHRLTDEFWISGGLGLAFSQTIVYELDSKAALGFDAEIGATIWHCGPQILKLMLTVTTGTNFDVRNSDDGYSLAEVSLLTVYQNL